MKIILAIATLLFALASSTVSSGEEQPVTVSIGETATSVSVSFTGGESPEFRLDVRDIPVESLDYAALRLKARSNGAEGEVPLWGLFEARTKRILRQLYIHPKKARYYTLNITGAVRDALAEGRDAISLVLKVVSDAPSDLSARLDRVQFLISDRKAAMLSLAEMTTPFWISGVVRGETIFPDQSRLPLLAAPTGRVSLFDGLRVREFVPVSDFAVTGDELILRGGAAGLIVPDSVIFPADKESAQNRAFPSRKGGFLLSPEGTWFQSKQLSVDYNFDPADWEGPRPEPQPELLPRTMELLEEGEPLRLVAFGDSITFGANATALSGDPPYQWSWSTLVAEALADRFDTRAVARVWWDRVGAERSISCS